MNRLKQIKGDIGHPLNFLGLLDLVEEKYRDLLRKVEQFCLEHLHSEQFLTCYQKAEFPYYLLSKLDELDIAGYFVPAPYGKELPLLVQGLLISIVAVHDLGVSSFLFLQLSLSARTISLLGSEEQKKKYLPDLISLKKICGWALTEREVGSNSTRLGTTFTQKGEGYELSGDKRWIGNGVHDLVIVYGNLVENKEKRVVGVIVDVKAKGVSAVPIPNKYAFRIVQNGQIDLDKVRITKEDLLPGASSYKSGV